MSKTPISQLQEIAAKTNVSMPVYTFTNEKIIGSNDHEFHIRVNFKNLLANGIGPTKQVAKHNAAKKMLEQLGFQNSDSSKIEPIMQPINSLQISEVPMGINYIGLLHEYCAKNRMKLPVFSECSWGPDHQLNFTAKCQVGDTTGEGSGRNKKLARTAAAKVVFDILSKDKKHPLHVNKVKNIDGDFGLNVEEIKVEEILPDYNAENKIALERYLKLTKLTVTPLLNEKITFENCHQIFTSEKYDTTLRQKILNLLAEINTENPSYLEKYLSKIEEVAKLLNVQFKSFNLTLNRSAVIEDVNVNYAIGLKLYTEPAIFGIGDGATDTSARLQAILNMRNNLRLLLI